MVETIGHAKKTIRVQAYSFTSASIAAALTVAHDHGVDVRVDLYTLPAIYRSAL